MRQKILFTLIAIAAFLFVFQQSAFPETYRFKDYSVDDGLPDATVTAIYQDRDGYLWFGTRGGVSRFDGRNFVNYSTRDGLICNDIFSIFQDIDGSMWFLTMHGVGKFDGKNWKVIKGKKGRWNQVFLYGAADSTGGVWLSSREGLIRVLGDSIEIIDTKKLGKEFGEVSRVSRVIQDKAGNLWVGTNNGILKYDGSEWKAYKKSTGVGAIYEDSKGTYILS